MTDAKDLPIGVWVHLAANYDSQVMKIYMNEEECGYLARTGTVNPNDFHLCLGSFEQEHEAHFVGKLDEPKLYDRALTADEIRKHAQSR